MNQNIQVEFIDKSARSKKRVIIKEVANIIYGNEAETKFTEEYIPLGGRVPFPKVQNFCNYLIDVPQLLWVVKKDENMIGFILVSDRPYPNAIGMGINSQFAQKGIMSDALSDILLSSEIEHPVYGYTSDKNFKAIKLMKNLGFEKDGDITFLGESSIKLKLEKHP